MLFGIKAAAGLQGFSKRILAERIRYARVCAAAVLRV
jgi:hypothetical protein